MAGGGLLCLLAVPQILVGLAGYVLILISADWSWGTHGIFVMQALVRVGAATLLLVAGWNDRRTMLFGTCLLLTATSYITPGLERISGAMSSTWFDVFAFLSLDALLPYFFWCFARIFPFTFMSRLQKVILDWVERGVLGLGLFMIFANIMNVLNAPISLYQAFDAGNPTGAYPLLVYGLAFPALILLWYRTRTAREDERRRVQVFTLGLVISLIPPLIFIVATSVSDTVTRFVLQDNVAVILIPMLQVFVLANPIVTAYAVLVERILPVHILLKQTVRYSLGHGFVLLALAAPLGLFIYYLFVLRTQTVTDLLSGLNGLFLLLAIGATGFFFSRRQLAARYLEKFFFREPYDANSLLTALSAEIAGSDTLTAVSDSVRATVEQALHPESCYLVILSGDDLLSDPSSELSELPLQSPFGSAIATLTNPTRVAQLTAILNPAETLWVEQANAHIFAPVRLRSRVCAVLILGSKKSEMVYTIADFNFLMLICNSLAIHIGDLVASWHSEDRAAPTLQCEQCSHVFARAAECPNCASHEFGPALLPKVLHNRYEVSSVLAFGGMGIVYLATDIRLQRTVVLKTVQSADAEELNFIRSEARLMATLSHPNIATIYGYESFHGMPILICEYLEGGTLEKVIRHSFLAADEIKEIALRLCDALKYLHNRGILHGDIKPANIGFSAEDVPKLLDFGLAGAPTAAKHSDHRGGTYAYMSPELLAHNVANPRSDFWALSVTLYEAFTGTNPFAAADLTAISEKINHADTLEIDGSPELQHFFQRAFAKRVDDRPQNARQYEQLLQSLP